MVLINFNLLSREETELLEQGRISNEFIGTAANDRLIGRPRVGSGEAFVDFNKPDSIPPIVSGLGGNDTIIGSLSKSNRIAGGPGSDKITGGRGIDLISVGSIVDIQGGTFVQDTISDRNVVRALGGNDKIDIGNGIDIVYAGTGNDSFFLNYGSTIDFLQVGGNGRDKIFGQGGNDIIVHGDDAGKLNGGSGTDTIIGGLGDDRITGGSGDDRIRGDLSNVADAPTLVTYFPGFYQRAYDKYLTERASSRGGSDVIDGGVGNDIIYGEGGADILRGGRDRDVLYGGGANDELYGGNGDDSLFGGDRNDTLYGNLGKDQLVGGNGRDVFFLGKDLETSLAANSTRNASVDTAIGGSGNDRFEVVTRKGPRNPVQVVGDIIAGKFRGPDNPNRIRGGDGKDEVFVNTNPLLRQTSYGIFQHTIFEDFQPGIDRPVSFQEGDEINFSTVNNGSGTDVYYRVPATGVVDYPGINAFEALIFRFENHRNVSINNSKFFNFLQG